MPFIAVPATAKLIHQSRDQDIFQHRTLGQKMMQLKNKANVLVADAGELFLGKLCQVTAIEQDFARSRPIQSADDVQ
jgi:hypothetical protein